MTTTKPHPAPAPLLIDLADLAADLAGIEQALVRWKALDAKAQQAGRLSVDDEAERSRVSGIYMLQGQHLLNLIAERVRLARPVAE
ncbi:hypothetical protein [Pseudomonas sp. TE50-2]|uniref:hypothetical protein n=1 Tax=Pseudomonas sp. TE50-2 TaxID=3142707 RepID=UPI00346701AC